MEASPNTTQQPQEPVDSSALAARGKTETKGPRVPNLINNNMHMCTILSSSKSTDTDLIIGIVVVVVAIIVTVFTVVVIIAVVIKKHSGKKTETTVKNAAAVSTDINIPTTAYVTSNQAYGLTRHHNEGVEDYIYDYPADLVTSDVIIEGSQAMLQATEKNQSSVIGVKTVDDYDYI